MKRDRAKNAAVASTVLSCVVLGLVAASAGARVTAYPAVLKPGSPRHPQGLKLQASFSWLGLSASSQPILTNFDMWFPRGSRYNGARYPTCPLRTLDTAGPSACPKRSIMGHGTGIAFADTTTTRPSITVINGGASTVYFYTVLNNPARVQEPVVGHITRTPGDFTYHLAVTIPQNLRVVAGVPIELTHLSITAGRGTWLATASPPAGIKVTGTFSTGSKISFFVWAQDS